MKNEGNLGCWKTVLTIWRYHSVKARHNRCIPCSPCPSAVSKAALEVRTLSRCCSLQSVSASQLSIVKVRSNLSANREMSANQLERQEVRFLVRLTWDCWDSGLVYWSE